MGSWVPPRGFDKKQVRAQLARRDGLLCQLCGSYMLEGDRTIDHRVARADGGTNKLENLQLAHRACNEDQSKAWMMANVPGYNSRRKSGRGFPRQQHQTDAS